MFHYLVTAVIIKHLVFFAILQIQGEIFSFYLSRLLGFGNVPPASLDLVEAGGPQWDRIRPELTLAQWMEQRPVVMTQWVDGLEPAHIPAPFRPSSRHLHPPDVNLQVCSTATSCRVFNIIIHR
jgi:four-jointed box protein 1